MRWFDDRRVLIGCVAGGFVGGIGIASTWQFNPQKDFWDVLAAIGTVSAAIIALAISLRDGFRRDREANERASLAAARISGALTLAKISLEDADRRFKAYDAAKDQGKFAFHQIIQALHSATPRISDSDLSAMVALPNRCAQRLAHCIALLQIIHQQMIDFKNTASSERWADVCPQMMTHWSLIAHGARRLLAAAHRDTMAAAGAADPFPDLEEGDGSRK